MANKEPEALNEEPEHTTEPAESVEESNPLHDDVKIEGSTTESFTDKVKRKMNEIKEVATLEVRMPVITRLQRRLKKIRELSSATTMKIDGRFETTSPKMHILNLYGRKIAPDMAEITYSVYDSDKNGNKIAEFQRTPMENAEGKTFEKITSAQYTVGVEVKETIKKGEPIKQVVTKFRR